MSVFCVYDSRIYSSCMYYFGEIRKYAALRRSVRECKCITAEELSVPIGDSIIELPFKGVRMGTVSGTHRFLSIYCNTSCVAPSTKCIPGCRGGIECS